MNKYFYTVTYNWLVQRVMRLHPDLLCYALFMKLFTILKHRGKRGVIDFCKECRSSLYTYLEKISDHDKDKNLVGIHPSLRFLKKYSNNDIITRLRLVLSILSISRGIHLKSKPDISPLTDVSLRSIKLSEIGKYRYDFWKELGYRPRKGDVYPRSLQWSRFHLTTHTGPNGHGLWGAASDLLSLSEQQFQDIATIGGNKLKSKMCTFRDGLNLSQSLIDFFSARVGITRKLTSILAPEGKNRIVAILDYWSQTALRPLHRYLFNCLRKIRQDCTFDQGSFLKKLPNNGDIYDSVDLTAATDRFPIDLIALILRAQLGSTYVSAWKRIMVDTPFHSSFHKELISYEVGNPMGAYSSWASFTLTHHYVMYYCCRELGIVWRDSSYVILGDDIVIQDRKLAILYKEVMTSLGVRFSEKKSHSSKHFFEFAKRPHWNGVEITPFPISGLVSTMKTPSMMASVLLNEHGRGWDIKEKIPQLLSELWSLQKLPRSLIRSRCILISTSLLLLETLKGGKSAEDVMTRLLDLYFPDLKIKGDISREGVFDSFLSIPVIQSFSDSFNRFNDSDEPFGDKAVEAVIIITSIDNSMLDTSDLILSVPFLAIHGRVEETYMRVRTKIKDKSTHSSWKNDLRSMIIPISDKIYYIRNQDLAMVSSFRLSKLVLKSIGIFCVLNNVKLPLNLKKILGRFPQLAKSYRGCSPMECLFS